MVRKIGSKLVINLDRDFMNLRNFNNKLFKIGGITPDFLRSKGAVIGENVRIYSNKIDVAHAFLLEIGNNVTISDARILLHDASTKNAIGYTKVGRVKIGNNVFVGADSIILPNVEIGDDVIIGAGCVVAKDVPNNCVVVGNPAKIISSYDDYIDRNRSMKSEDNTWNTYHAQKSFKEKSDMINKLKNGGFGFDI